MASEDLMQPKDWRVFDLAEQIARLKSGKAVIIGGESDIRYLHRKIEKLRTEEPSLAEKLDDLVAELDTVDPSLSTFEARRNRSPLIVESNEINWNNVKEDALQVLGILDGESKTSAKITMEAAQAVVDERNLEDGVYTLRNARGEVYIVVRGMKVESQIFEPPSYDIGYIMRGSPDLNYKGAIQF